MALGLAADLGDGAGRGLDRGEDRAGPRPAPSGIGRVGSRLVANSGRARLQGEGRGQQLLVVEAAMAGDEDRVDAARGLAVERVEPGVGRRPLEGLGADHEGGGADAHALGGERRRRHPRGDDPPLLGLDPELAQALGVDARVAARVVGDEDDLLAGARSARPAPPPSPAPARARSRRRRRGRPGSRRRNPQAPSLTQAILGRCDPRGHPILLALLGASRAGGRRRRRRAAGADFPGYRQIELHRSGQRRLPGPVLGRPRQRPALRLQERSPVSSTRRPASTRPGPGFTDTRIDADFGRFGHVSGAFEQRGRDAEPLAEAGREAKGAVRCAASAASSARSSSTARAATPRRARPAPRPNSIDDAAPALPRLRRPPDIRGRSSARGPGSRSAAPTPPSPLRPKAARLRKSSARWDDSRRSSFSASHGERVGPIRVIRLASAGGPPRPSSSTKASPRRRSRRRRPSAAARPSPAAPAGRPTGAATSRSTFPGPSVGLVRPNAEVDLSHFPIRGADGAAACIACRNPLHGASRPVSGRSLKIAVVSVCPGGGAFDVGGGRRRLLPSGLLGGSGPEFALQAPGGYRLSVSRRRTPRSLAHIRRRLRHRPATSAPGTAAAGRVEARFGRFGRVAVSFEPTASRGGCRRFPGCRGKPPSASPAPSAARSASTAKAASPRSTPTAPTARVTTNPRLALRRKEAESRPERPGRRTEEEADVGRLPLRPLWRGPLLRRSAASSSSKPAPVFPDEREFTLFGVERRRTGRLGHDQRGIFAARRAAAAFSFDDALTTATVTPPPPFSRQGRSHRSTPPGNLGLADPDGVLHRQGRRHGRPRFRRPRSSLADLRPKARPAEPRGSPSPRRPSRAQLSVRCSRDRFQSKREPGRRRRHQQALRLRRGRGRRPRSTSAPASSAAASPRSWAPRARASRP